MPQFFCAVQTGQDLPGCLQSPFSGLHRLCQLLFPELRGREFFFQSQKGFSIGTAGGPDGCLLFFENCIVPELTAPEGCQLPAGGFQLPGDGFQLP